MQFMPLLAISPRFFTPLFSRYHNALLEFDGAARVLIPYQHFTFIPLLMVAKFGEIPSQHPRMILLPCLHLLHSPLRHIACLDPIGPSYNCQVACCWDG